jgi:hypothetical protein
MTSIFNILTKLVQFFLNRISKSISFLFVLKVIDTIFIDKSILSNRAVFFNIQIQSNIPSSIICFELTVLITFFE